MSAGRQAASPVPQCSLAAALRSSKSRLAVMSAAVLGSKGCGCERAARRPGLLGHPKCECRSNFMESQQHGQTRSSNPLQA